MIRTKPNESILKLNNSLSTINLITQKQGNVYVVSKGHLRDTIRFNLENTFENSDNYFKELPNIVIGKIPKGPIINKDTNEYINHTLVCQDRINKHLHHFSNGSKPKNNFLIEKIKKLKSKHASRHFSGNEKQLTLNSNSAHKLNSPQYEVVDNNRINEIEEKFKLIAHENNPSNHDKNLEQSFSTPLLNIMTSALNCFNKQSENINKPKRNNSFKKSLLSNSTNIIKSTHFKTETSLTDYSPMRNRTKDENQSLISEIDNIYIDESLAAVKYKEIRNELLKQERNLSMFEYENKKIHKIESYLEKRLNTHKDKLLLNSGDNNMIKSELVNLLESKIPIEEKRGIFNWYLSLRKPNNQKENKEENRFVYINLGTEDKPSWRKVNDKKTVYEAFGNPNVQLGKSKIFSENTKFKKEIKSIENNKVSHVL